MPYTKPDSQTAFCSAGPNNINWLFEFSETPLKMKYRMFKVASTSPRYALMIALFVSVGFGFYWGMVLDVYVSFLPLLLFVFSFIFAILFMWTIVILRFLLPLSEQQDRYRVLLACLESITMLGLVVSICSVVGLRSQHSCASHSLSDIWTCYLDSSHAVVGDVSLILVSFPFILSIGFPFVPYFVVIISLLIAAGCLLTVLVSLDILGASTFVIISILFNIFLLIFTRLQSMELFLYLIKYYGMVEERIDYENQLSKTLNDEMRNLIASVSHDIKSVSFSVLFSFSFCLFLSFLVSFFFSFLLFSASFCVYSWFRRIER
jgi:hypothetical protein